MKGKEKKNCSFPSNAARDSLFPSSSVSLFTTPRRGEEGEDWRLGITAHFLSLLSRRFALFFFLWRESSVTKTVSPSHDSAFYTGELCFFRRKIIGFRQWSMCARGKTQLYEKRDVGRPCRSPFFLPNSKLGSRKVDDSGPGSDCCCSKMTNSKEWRNGIYAEQ